MIYLIRHADALFLGGSDDVRPLSPQGREDAGRLGVFLRTGDRMRATEIWHSPLRRARETAELIAAGLGTGLPLHETDDLRSEDDPGLIAARLSRHPGLSVAIVGHEPFLSSLASLLATGAMEPRAFVMNKCAILALERYREGPDGCCVACWHLSPELLPA